MIRRIKITTRLFLFLGVILMLILTLGGISLLYLSQLAQSTNELYDHPFTVSNSLKEMEIYLFQIVQATDDLLDTKNDVDFQLVIDRINKIQEDFEKESEIVRERYFGDSADVAALMTSTVRWRQARDKMIEAKKSHKDTEARAIRASLVTPARIDSLEKIDKLAAFSTEKASDFAAQARSSTSSAILFMAIFLAIAWLVSTILAIILSRSIWIPLKSLVEKVELASQGNLTVDIAIENEKDEITFLKRSLRIMLQNLRTQTKETLDSVTTLAAAASEITATGTQLAAAATETATSITETTVTAEEVKQTAQVAMERAKEVSQSADTTLATSLESMKSVEDTLTGIRQIRDQMERIAQSILELNEQSRSIGEIISSVDDIAEQSNLLAVNAAIEAAKAGEQGRGFAVVAREIRSLSEQSRAATKQVRTILTDIQKAMQAAVLATEQGNKAADSNHQKSEVVAQSLKSLAGNIETTSQMAQQIIAANQQQYTGIDQVTMAMESIKEASRQNVDAARQLEDAAVGLDTLSQTLKKLVGRYVV